MAFVIQPHNAALDFIATTPSYVYDLWSNSATYAIGDCVRWAVSGGYYDYRALVGHAAADNRNPGNTYIWAYIGPSAVSSSVTYQTNVRLSQYNDWTSGQAVAQGQAVFDKGDQSDYVALEAIAAGDNTTRPSQAVRAMDETLASRWLALGKANAWAWSDYEIASRVASIDPSNAIISSIAAVINCGTTAFACNRIGIVGLRNASAITARVYHKSGAWTSGELTNIRAGSTTTMSGVTRVDLGASLVRNTASALYLNTAATLSFTQADAGRSLMIWLYVSQRDAGTPAEMGAVVIGYGHDVPSAEWEVETSLIDFSRRDRDPDFGTVRFIKRGTAKTVRATCYLDGTLSGGNPLQSGDNLLRLMNLLSGQPLYFDLNASDTDFDRLRIFGLCKRAASVIKAMQWESVSLELEGMIE